MSANAWVSNRFVLVLGLIGITSAAWAEPFPVNDLPPQLRPWVPWVLDAHREWGCPVVDDESVCVWPGEALLELGKDGGSFEMFVRTDAEMDVELPGGDRFWPQDVRVDGRRVVVLGENVPSVRLDAGSYRVTGRLFWEEMPQELMVPSSVALVKLRVDGRPIPFPRRDGDGTLRLQHTSSNVEEDERLDMTVMRKVSDGVPVWVETRLVLRVSGKSREVTLPDALVKGTVPLSVVSEIPARLTDQGALILQVRAGTHTVTILSRTENDVDLLKSIARNEPWPGSEIWVWESDERIRQASVSGPPGVDPSRTSLPAEWHGLPAFMIEPDAQLKITTRRRGQPKPPPDQIKLKREMWMDLDGNRYTIQDTLKGSLSRAWRLDLQTKGNLGHVSVGGSDRLITKNPTSGKAGVELRDKSLNMVAEWRTPAKGRGLPAVGWSEDVQELEATVHLPPGWTVLFAKGVDNLPGTWWDQWDLWGFFFVLIISFAVAKLTKPLYGVLAFVALVLCYHEADAPSAVWVSLLASLGLLKVLPRGVLRTIGRFWCWLSIIWLAAVLIPFSVQQVRTGLFPQIEGADDSFLNIEYSRLEAERGPPKEGISYQQQFEDQNIQAELDAKLEVPTSPGEMAEGGGAGGPEAELLQAIEKPKMAAPRKQMAREAEKMDGLLESVGVVGSGAENYPSQDSMGYKKGKMAVRKAMQQDPKAVVQTGPGVPNWRWTTMRLTWSGPVTKDHLFKLYMLSPVVNLIISIVRVLLLVVIALRVAHELLRVLKNPAAGEDPSANGGKGEGPGSGQNKTAQAVVATVILVGFMMTPTKSFAGEVPDESTLTQLGEKLTRAPACRPDCISASSLAVSVRADRLELRAEVHAGETSSWPIPGPTLNWVPDEVRVDGRQTQDLSTLGGGHIHVRLEPGYHEVVAAGPVPPGNTFTIELGVPPHYASVEAPGFAVEGILENGRTEGSIQLSRNATDSLDPTQTATFKEGSYPPWLEVTRTFDFGIPWLLHTRVQRVSPLGTPIMTRIPLLKGESVTDSEVEVNQGSVVVAMGRDESELVWSSTLAEEPKMKLSAATGSPWTEIWKLDCSPVWQCAYEGLAPVDSIGESGYQPNFMPWPGESLSLSLSRPEGIEGQSITIDTARMTLFPGVRLVKAQLGLWTRSSQGGLQVITLPKGAQVQSLDVDGTKRTFRVQGDKLEINLKPGSQKIDVVWQQKGGIKSLYRVPKVRLGRESVNATVTVKLPGDRWLLLAGGPDWGPAVLFWGFLVTILLGGVILGRIKISPLKSWQWMLLALGLTQVPVPVTLIIVGWFLVLAWRAKENPKGVVLHNTVQIGLGIWTVTALGCLVGVIYNGLAVRPDMQVQGAGSTNTSLVWYVDRIGDTLPSPWVASVPILVWKLIMLAWALWLAGSIIKWAPWAWQSFSARTLWLKAPKKAKREKTTKKTVSA